MLMFSTLSCTVGILPAPPQKKTKRQQYTSVATKYISKRFVSSHSIVLVFLRTCMYAAAVMQGSPRPFALRHGGQRRHDSLLPLGEPHRGGPLPARVDGGGHTPAPLVRRGRRERVRDVSGGVGLARFPAQQVRAGRGREVAAAMSDAGFSENLLKSQEDYHPFFVLRSIYLYRRMVHGMSCRCHLGGR